MEKETIDLIKEWEDALDLRNLARMYKTEKWYRDPRVKKYRDYSHHRHTQYFYRHECRWTRSNTNRKFRKQFKMRRDFEEALIPVPHDYKTYGWMTW